jgi:hypothetical protein
MQVINGDSLKAQSAMEYLMTYGWALLIMAIVLVALFGMGVFTTSNLLGSSCTAAPGYVCKGMSLSPNGNLTFTFGYSGGIPIYNVQFACTSLSTPSGGPNPLTSFNSITVFGNTILPTNTGNTLQPQQTLLISLLPCYNSRATPVGAQQLGTPFTGYLWLNYTYVNSPAGTTQNPWLTAKAAIIVTKVS